MINLPYPKATGYQSWLCMKPKCFQKIKCLSNNYPIQNRQAQNFITC